MIYDNVFGAPPPDLAQIAPGARQFSPLVPGAEDFALVPPGALANLVLLAPPGAVERRTALALALRALAPGAPFLVMAPKDKGGGRIAKELAEFGCPSVEHSKRHHRLCAAGARGAPPRYKPRSKPGRRAFRNPSACGPSPGCFPGTGSTPARLC